MHLDFRITFIAIAVCCFLFAGGLFIFQTREFRRNGVLEWVVGQFLLGVYWIFLGLRGLVPDLLSIFVANVCLSASYSSLYVAVRKFKHSPYRRDLLFLPVVATLLIFLFFWAYTDNMFARSVYITFVSGMQTGFIASILLRDASLQVRRSQWFTGCMFALVTTLWFIRFLELLISPGQRFNFPETNPFWQVVLILGCGVVILLSIGALLMIRERSEEDLRRSETRLARLNDCFLQFGASPDDNINRLVAVCGELMNATCALYNRLGKNLLCSVGQWRTPAGFKSEDEPKGHICYDVIQHGGEHPLLVRNLQESHYARTDPNILPYGLQTYLGMVVKWKQATVGSLCVVYQTDITPSNDDLHFMTIIASAIAVEEDRRRVEEALRGAEENFRRSLDESPLGMRIVTAEGETIYANRTILDLFSIEELNTTPLIKRYTTESYAEFQIRKEKRKRGDYSPSEYEISIVNKTGEVRRLQVFRKTALWDGEKQFLVIYQDITERKQAEQALRESEARYRQLVEYAPAAIYEADLTTGRLLSVNEVLCEYSGYTRDELLALHPLDLMTEESKKLILQRMAGYAAGEPVPPAVEYKARSKSGREFWISTHAKYFYQAGLPVRATVVAYDITKRKEVEKKLRASREQMRALAGRLQTVREEERTRIAREIHDDLGGALTGLKIDFSLLAKTALKIENENVRTSLLAGMDSMTKFIDATIQNVRRIAMELRPSILDDVGLVATLEWQLKDFEKRTGILCKLFLPGEHISLDPDLSTALFRIFQEALTNVARHSGATEIRVHLHMDGDSTTMEIEDNGKGIGKRKILSSKSLGLLGMRERAQMFGGHITVTGTPGTGTKVTVEISSAEKRKMDRDQDQDQDQEGVGG
jgi:PAS domain S-box-containing protein